MFSIFFIEEEEEERQAALCIYNFKVKIATDWHGNGHDSKHNKL